MYQSMPGKNQPQAGFTLLELLVVLAVLGIAFGMVALSVGGLRFDLVKQEVNALKAYMQVANEDAVLEGKVLGLRFKKSADQFHYYWLLRQQDQGWDVYRSDMLDLTEFDKSVDLTLTIEGIPVDWDKKLPVDPITGEAEQLPHIVFLPGGGQTAFELLVDDREGAQSWKLDVDSLGMVEVNYEARESR